MNNLTSPRAVLKIIEMNENPNHKGCDDADTDTEKINMIRMVGG